MKYKLEPDDLTCDFDGWAFLLFRSTLPSYIFADSLNRLYHCRLERIDDLPLNGAAWPFYRYDDSVRHLKYFLTERPAAATSAPWSASDKLLAVKGETAAVAIDKILNDFTAPRRCTPGDLLAEEHAALLDELQAAFTVAAPIDLNDDTPVSRRGQKERALVEQWCSDLLGYIDSRHLDLSDDEQRDFRMTSS